MRDNKDFYVALDMAITAHHKQSRQTYKNYVVHPVEVCQVLMADPEIPNEVGIAALLHDALEDGGMTFEDIAEKLGDNVAQLVAEVTDDPRLPRWQQKVEQVQKIRTMSYGALCLKLADRLVNVAGLTSKKPGDKYITHTEEMLDAFDARIQETDPYKHVHFRHAIVLASKIRNAIRPTSSDG